MSVFLSGEISCVENLKDEKYYVQEKEKNPTALIKQEVVWHKYVTLK